MVEHLEQKLRSELAIDSSGVSRFITALYILRMTNVVTFGFWAKTSTEATHEMNSLPFKILSVSE